MTRIYRRESQPEAAHARLAPAEVVSHLVPDRALDLRAEQRRVVAEVALQGVLEDDDAVGVDVAGHGAADVLAVGAVLPAPARHDHGRRLEDLAELLRQLVERLHDE